MSGRNAPDPFSAPRRPASLGKYHLLKKIGAGGMAEIWVASVAGISGVRKVCVIKQILPHLADSPEFVRMFLDEARIAATLDHPNLVQMYDIEEVAGVPVIAMEYLHGEDLRTVKKTLRSANRRMPLEHAVGITMGVAAGLHYAHEKVGFDGKPLNIVHRDVSPHNVFITYDGAVKILDFGIAKAANRVNETRDGALKGKVPYMSPEQCRSEELDRRTDIYSAGILLYEMSTGSRLFRRGATEFELMRAIVEDPVMPPSLVMSEYPPALERIVLKCLAQDRAQRYATARELQVDLEAFAREERLATSALALSSFMSELFGKRAEAWRGAFSSEAELLSHIAEKQESDIQSDDSGSGELHGRAQVTPPPASVGPRGGAATKLSPSHAPPPLEPAPDAAAPPPRSDKVPSVSAAGAAEPSETPGPRSLTVTKRKLGSLIIVSLSGRMTEQLQGLMVAKGITGRVLFDLGGVQRVTSFGVREWLVMLGEVSQNTSELYIGRCTEPIVNQVSMIRRFFGDGRIVSFYGPYRCERCGNAFERLFDCDRDAQVLRACDPPSSPCPRCGAAAVFDDDAESYFAFAAAHAGVQLPADVRAALDELAKLDEGGQETIEKTVDERGTRIRVRCKLDAHVRWKRAFDGIEGDLVLELTGAGEVSPEGARALELALRGLGDEVRSIAIEGCPAALLEHLGAVRPPLRATIGSALVDGVCERCNAPRQTLLDVREAVVAALDDREPYMPCKRCNAPLSFLALRPVLKRLGAAAEARGELPGRSTSPAGRSIAPEPPASSRARSSALLLPAPSATGGGGVGWPVAIALGAGLLLLGASIVARDSAGSRGSADPAAQAGPSEPVAASELKARGAPPPGAPRPGAPQREDRPAWVQQPFVLEGDVIFVVGEGAGESREAALSVARADAISRLASNVVPALAGSAAYGFIQARSGGERRAGMAEAEASRYLKQVGAFATPERVDARFQERGGQVLAVARYRMRKQDFDAAVESYRRTVSVLGLTAAPVFPLLEGELKTSGDAVVVALESAGPAASAGIRVGDVVVAVNGRPLVTIDALPRAVQSASAAGAVELTVEAGGERRTVAIKTPPSSVP